MTTKKSAKQLKAYFAEKLFVGWNEWCSLPELGMPAIKAKIDTGAKTSALHAFNIKIVRKKGKKFVRFNVHPIQGDNITKIACEVPLVDQRPVMSSSGHKENRYVISTLIELGKKTWRIKLTLSNRDPLKFRMLLGREALNNRVLIDPKHSLCLGRIRKEKLKKLYLPK